MAMCKLFCSVANWTCWWRGVIIIINWLRVTLYITLFGYCLLTILMMKTSSKKTRVRRSLIRKGATETEHVVTNDVTTELGTLRRFKSGDKPKKCAIDDWMNNKQTMLEPRICETCGNVDCNKSKIRKCYDDTFYFHGGVNRCGNKSCKAVATRWSGSCGNLVIYLVHEDLCNNTEPEWGKIMLNGLVVPVIRGNSLGVLEKCAENCSSLLRNMLSTDDGRLISKEVGWYDIETVSSQNPNWSQYLKLAREAMIKTVSSEMNTTMSQIDTKELLSTTVLGDIRHVGVVNDADSDNVVKITNKNKDLVNKKFIFT